MLDASGAVKTRLESTALPLGIAPDTHFPLGAAVALESGDAIFLVTDGILEAQSPAGEAFGVAHLLDTVRAANAGTSAETVERLFQAVKAFCEPEKPVDDITAVVVRVQDGA